MVQLSWAANDLRQKALGGVMINGGSCCWQQLKLSC
jgi:hypothetical protein